MAGFNERSRPDWGQCGTLRGVILDRPLQQENGALPSIYLDTQHRIVEYPSSEHTDTQGSFAAPLLYTAIERGGDHLGSPLVENLVLYLRPGMLFPGA